MACVAFIMTGKISEHSRSVPPGVSEEISDNTEMTHVDEHDSEDKSCIPLAIDGTPSTHPSTNPQQSMKSSEKASNSRMHAAPSSSRRPFQGKSILPPVLLKCHTNPTPVDHDDGWRIRSRYLHSLGMDEQIQHHDHPKSFSIARSTQHPKTCSDSHGDSSGCVNGASARTALEQNHSIHPPPMTMEPLKDDHGNHDDDILARLISINANTDDWYDQPSFLLHPIRTVEKKKHSSIHNDDCNCSATTSNVSFYPIVTVREIPSHHSYSERIKKTIWMLPCEYAESVTKNVIEFMSEGYEPETVLDESDFVERDGELVHPVCLMLEEPDNVRLRKIYYGFTPKQSAKADRSPRHFSPAL